MSQERKAPEEIWVVASGKHLSRMYVTEVEATNVAAESCGPESTHRPGCDLLRELPEPQP